VISILTLVSNLIDLSQFKAKVKLIILMSRGNSVATLKNNFTS